MSQTQKTGTIYRFIRVPDIPNNVNQTVVLIKNPENIARVQKINNSNNNQTVSVKLSTENAISNEKKIKTRVNNKLNFSYCLTSRLFTFLLYFMYAHSEMTTDDFSTIKSREQDERKLIIGLWN